MTRTALFLVCTASALVFAAAATAPQAATPIALEKLSPADRLSGAPDATVVQLGPRALTLGALRAQHKARIAGFGQAAELGRLAGGKLIPVSSGPGLKSVGRPEPVSLSTASPPPMIEPPSDYSSTPKDMRAFCSAAHVSACAYLPPSQTLVPPSFGGSSVWDIDYLMDQQGCGQQGGTWLNVGWGVQYCVFIYPAQVTVRFTPASNYKLAQSASCDKMFHYTVDDHGAVGITVNGVGNGTTTGNDPPTCIVSVWPGGQ